MNGGLMALAPWRRGAAREGRARRTDDKARRRQPGRPALGDPRGADAGCGRLSCARPPDPHHAGRSPRAEQGRGGRDGRASGPVAASRADPLDRGSSLPVQLRAINAPTFIGAQAKAGLPAVKRAAVSGNEAIHNAGRYPEAVLEGRYEPAYRVLDVAWMLKIYSSVKG